MDEELTAIAALIVEGDRLRAELAQRDAFIAAFGKWLDGEKQLYKDYARKYRNEIGATDEWHVMINLGIKYNELKAQHLGTKAAHVLTAEQAQVLSLLSIGDMGDEIASALPVYAEFPILLSFGYVYVMDDSIDTDFEITDTGRAALKRYNVGRGKVE